MSAAWSRARQRRQTFHRASNELTIPLLRLDWTLLSADLSFTYVDPTLASDLDDQGDLLLGRCLFDFVHPKELVTARNDLGNVLGTRELHGSITRFVPLFPLLAFPTRPANGRISTVYCSRGYRAFVGCSLTRPP